MCSRVRPAAGLGNRPGRWKPSGRKVQIYGTTKWQRWRRQHLPPTIRHGKLPKWLSCEAAWKSSSRSPNWRGLEQEPADRNFWRRPLTRARTRSRRGNGRWWRSEGRARKRATTRPTPIAGGRRPAAPPHWSGEVCAGGGCCERSLARKSIADQAEQR
jgi:hypothetical protein